MPGTGADPASRPDLRALRRRPLFAPLAVPALLLAVALGVLGALWVAADTTTVIVVRHAEKELDGSADPALTPAGVARAEHLARQFGGAGITAVYATPLRRTKQTAAPVAAAAGVEVVATDPKDVAYLVELIRDQDRGGTVFVVGHSNTVGPIVRALGGEAPAELDDSDYDSLFIVTVPRFGRARTLRLKQ